MSGEIPGGEDTPKITMADSDKVFEEVVNQEAVIDETGDGRYASWGRPAEKSTIDAVLNDMPAAIRDKDGEDCSWENIIGGTIGEDRVIVGQAHGNEHLRHHVLVNCNNSVAVVMDPTFKAGESKTEGTAITETAEVEGEVATATDEFAAPDEFTAPGKIPQHVPTPPSLNLSWESSFDASVREVLEILEPEKDSFAHHKVDGKTRPIRALCKRRVVPSSLIAPTPTIPLGLPATPRYPFEGEPGFSKSKFTFQAEGEAEASGQKYDTDPITTLGSMRSFLAAGSQGPPTWAVGSPSIDNSYTQGPIGSSINGSFHMKRELCKAPALDRPSSDSLSAHPQTLIEEKNETIDANKKVSGVLDCTSESNLTDHAGQVVDIAEHPRSEAITNPPRASTLIDFAPTEDAPESSAEFVAYAESPSIQSMLGNDLKKSYDTYPTHTTPLIEPAPVTNGVHANAATNSELNEEMAHNRGSRVILVFLDSENQQVPDIVWDLSLASDRKTAAFFVALQEKIFVFETKVTKMNDALGPNEHTTFYLKRHEFSLKANIAAEEKSKSFEEEARRNHERAEALQRQLEADTKTLKKEICELNKDHYTELDCAKNEGRTFMAQLLRANKETREIMGDVTIHEYIPTAVEYLKNYQVIVEDLQQERDARPQQSDVDIEIQALQREILNLKSKHIQELNDHAKELRALVAEVECGFLAQDRMAQAVDKNSLMVCGSLQTSAELEDEPTNTTITGDDADTIKLQPMVHRLRVEPLALDQNPAQAEAQPAAASSQSALEDLHLPNKNKAVYDDAEKSHHISSDIVPTTMDEKSCESLAAVAARTMGMPSTERKKELFDAQGFTEEDLPEPGDAELMADILEEFALELDEQNKTADMLEAKAPLTRTQW